MNNHWFARATAAKSIRTATLLALLIGLLPAGLSAVASVPGPDVRLTNDVGGGYISEYTLATGQPYTDDVIVECGIARGRQNEPSVAVDPRNTSVLIGSSNDYCGVYSTRDSNGVPYPGGPVWLGYYRSQNGGTSFQSSLVPGYPGDTSPYGALAHVRTASAGDPVIAWDNHGRVFMGSESSDDPLGTKKTFGDVWVARFDNPDSPNGDTINDGKRFLGSEIVARGSSAPNLLGKFHDKTAIEVDRTGGSCDGNVYFSWSRFTGNGGVGIYFARSTDHGATFSNPAKISASIHDVQFSDISVTGNGNIFVTFRQFASQGQGVDAVMYAKSTNCGRTFAPPVQLTTFTPYDAQDVSDPQPIPTPGAGILPPRANGGNGGNGGKDQEGKDQDEPRTPDSTARDCGDFGSHCQSGYTFFRRDTQVRSTADQQDTAHQWIYIVYDPSKPGTETATGTTYGSITSGTGSQSAIYFTRLDGANGSFTTPQPIDNQATGHQLFPDISADGGILHTLWWDSRLDPFYSPTRPVGNNASGQVGPSLDVWSAKSIDHGTTWTTKTRLTDVTSNPNFEQFSDRTVPFAGDYLWVTSLGDFSFGTWTDWRNTVPGADPREPTAADGADVHQCRTFNSNTGTWSGDLCPHDGGIDQDIYGDQTP